MENNGAHDLIITSIGAAWFVCSITIVLALLNTGYDLTDKTKERISHNETIYGTNAVDIRDGYYEEGIFKYDGVLTGVEVLTNIVSNEHEVEISIVNNAGKNTVTQKRVQGEDFMEYASITDRQKLMKLLNMENTYIRKYVINAHGNVVEIIYEEIQNEET